MALLFSDGTSNKGDFGSAAGLDDLTTFTYAGWFFPTSDPAAVRGLVNKGTTGVQGNRHLRYRTGKFLELGVRRATTSTNYISNVALTLNSWQFCVTTYDEAASPTGHLYQGSLSAIVAE